MKQPKIRILVADDHLIVRDGIISIVEVEKDMRVIAQANDGVEALSLVKKHLPDIVLLDLRMPRMDGLEVIAQIQSLHLPSKVIVLTTFESEQDVHLALKAGARSYLLKDTPRSTLLDTIRQVHLGKTCIAPRIGQKLVENMNRPALSGRELDIIKLVAEGRSNKEIGDRLSITEGTVKTHIKSLLKKLQAPGRTAAVREAVHRGIVQLA
ncbi:MAG TPA: response regulator transcription factor [Candidatus Saccharimonadales bacterium]|nr:response regulator transcription factor [Candidatus Saccharimonadales bacterium]